MLYQNLATLLTSIGIASSIALPLHASEMGKAEYEQGNYEAAVSLWQESVQKYESQGDITNQALALSNLSLSLQRLGEWEAATKAIDRSLVLLASTENSLLLAQGLDIQGQLWQERGKSKLALESWQKAAKIYDRLGVEEKLVQNHLNQSTALRSLGLYRRACAIILQTLNLGGEECQITQNQIDSITPIKKQQSATALQKLGDVLRVVGELEQSELALRSGLRFTEELEDKVGTAKIYLGLADTYRALATRERLQQPNAAKEVALKNYQNLAEKHYLLLGKSIEGKLGLLRLAVDKGESITALVESIEVDLTSLPLNQFRIFTRIELAQHLLCQTHPSLSELERLVASPLLQPCRRGSHGEKTIPWAKISTLLKTAIAEAQTLGNKRGESYGVGYLAGVYHQQGNLKEAETLTHQALALASMEEASDIIYRWQWQLGRISRAQQKIPQSLNFYAAAFKTLQPLRRDLVAINQEIQFTFRDSIEPIYREYVDLLLSAENPTQPNLLEARTVIETLQLAELDDFFREACIDVKPKLIDEIDPRAVVFYPVIGARRLDVIVKLPGEQKLFHYAIAVDRNTVESTLKQLQAFLPDRTRSAQVRQLSQKVYNWLILPVEAKLAAAQSQQTEQINLVFVLDGLLRNVPMAALYDGKQYLMQKYPVALAPSLQLVDPLPIGAVKIEALLGGISEERTIGGRSFVGLPQVESELESVQKQLETKDKLLNPSFTSINFQEKLAIRDVPIVHIATHGKFSSNPDETFVLLWDQLLNVKDLNAILRTDERSIPLELLILSACQTAAGDDRAALGLAGVAIRAGARSTVATLWPVDDPFTAFFMSRFYEELRKPGATKAGALRKAQLAAIEKESRPYFWAPYTLIGNWL